MRVLFVHGMGRSPLSGWPMLWQLKRAGLKTSTFGYAVSLQDFPAIRKRLVSKIAALAAQEDYVLIGHSLGGVLLRAAVNSMPPGTRPPRRIFLLGSPLLPARLAQKLHRNLIYRVLTGDCGQLLGSTTRMSEVGPVSVPTTSIAGVRDGLPSKRGLFKGELNDGLVSISEVSTEWITDQVRIPIIHTFLPSCKRVAEIILERVARNDGQ
jgi:hypothetical protein